MIKMINADKARAKTEFAISVEKYITIFNAKIEEVCARGKDRLVIDKYDMADMNQGQWNLFVEMIENAGYRIVSHNTGDTVEVYW